MLESFYTYLESEKRVSEHTLTAYKKDLDTFIEFVGIDNLFDLPSVNHQLIRSWVVDLINNGLTNRTVNRKLSSLRTFFKWALKNELVISNPMLKVKGPKVESRIPEFIKQTDIDKVEIDFSEKPERDVLMIELFYQTGIRLSELINLKVSDVNKDSVKVLGKRNKERLVPISSELYKVIINYVSVNTVNTTPYLFCTDKGNKLYPKLVYRKINNYLSSITNLKKKSPHILRHTFATHMLNNGAGLETLKELLGHSNLSATQIYTHNSFEEINKIYKQAHPRGGHKKD